MRTFAQKQTESQRRVTPTGTRKGSFPAAVQKTLRAPGQPLESATREFMESRFGHDFSRVRIHADATAAESAAAVQARAYTVGQHIVLGADQPLPETRAGQAVLAHELAHVVQQSRSGPGPELNPSAPHEREAHAAAMAVTSGLPRVQISCQTGVGIARTNGDLGAVQAELDELLRDHALRDIVVRELGQAAIPLGSRVPAEAARRALEQAAAQGDPHAPDYLRRLNDIQDRLRSLTGMPPRIPPKPGPQGTGSQDEGGGESKIVKPPDAGGSKPAPKATMTTPSTSTSGTTPKTTTTTTGQPGKTTTPSQGTLAPVTPPAKTVKGEIRPPLAPTTPPAKTVGGEITTTPPSGGGPSKILTMPRVGSIALRIGASALEGLSQYLIAKSVANFEEKISKQRWIELQPYIQRAVESAGPDIEKTLKETGYRKTIYANIHMDDLAIMSVFHTRSGSSWRWAFAGLNFVGVDISAQNIQGPDKSYTTGAAYAPVWHRPFTYSVPIAEPAAQVLPVIRTVHNLLAAIRTDLITVRGGSAGEGVALDKLTVAQEATEYTRASVFQGRTAAERFQLTVNAINESLDFVKGAAGENPAIESLRGRLWSVKVMADGLADRWPLMVDAHGQ